MSEFSISQIAEYLEGEVVGNLDIKISHLAKIEEAKEGDLTFLANPKYRKFAETTKASAIIVSNDFLPSRKDLAYIKVMDPYYAFLKALEKVEMPKDTVPLTGIHPSAIIAKSASIGENVYIGPYVVIGENCCIGTRTIIHSGTFIDNDSNVGENTLIYSNVSIREKCKIGSNVILHSGVVIGSDGFGFVPKKDGTYQKLPQLGGVIIEDDVEIGSNCTIDRATLGNTIIKKGVKLDNLIQVAHNVSIGENTIIASQTGISGSTKIGKNCRIAGQVGFIGHIEIADNTTIAAQSGISKSLKQPGMVYFGSPVKEHKQAFRIEGAIKQLPELLTEVQRLKRQVEELTNKLNTKIEEKK
jgi:UDP-3-O-[3-hydroxymyristoyl] glucosamine N-acyltransferase